MPSSNMHRSMMLMLSVSIFLLALVDAAAPPSSSKYLVSLNEENWRDLLEGEWMVEFHATWCPACKDLQKSWNAFADWSKDLNIKVAEVDVTLNPGLSGRFLVTALPTIYHVKDGIFRSYMGPRDKNDFISFIEEKKWSIIEPVSSFKHPNSMQMAVVSVFFKLSMSVRDLHNYLVEEIGMPSWASYSLFAGVTLGLGCVLGFFIVCIIDYVFPSGGAAAATTTNAKTDKKQKKKDQQKKKNAEKEEEKARLSQDEASQNSQDDDGNDSADESKPRHRATADKVTPQKSPKQAPTTPKSAGGSDGKKKN